MDGCCLHYHTGDPVSAPIRMSQALTQELLMAMQLTFNADDHEKTILELAARNHPTLFPGGLETFCDFHGKLLITNQIPMAQVSKAQPNVHQCKSLKAPNKIAHKNSTRDL